MIPPVHTPCAVGEIELSEPFEPIELGVSRAGQPYRSALLLARCEGEPLGFVHALPDEDGTVQLSELRAALGEQLPGWDAPSPPPEFTVAGAQHVTVVVTARERPDALVTTVQSVLDCDWPRFDVVVVSHRPDTADVLRESFRGHPQLRCVEEPRAGVSWARNAGVAVAQGEIVAFTDEGVVVDEGWIRALAGALERTGAACVSGPALPLELETPQQVLVEQLAGSTTESAPRTLSLADGASPRRLAVRAAEQLGPGFNLGVRADALRAAGGFDPALGRGTPARGGEDIDLYLRLLDAGHAIGYEPGALVWRRPPEALTTGRRDAFAHGIGLGAAIAKHARDPDRLGGEIRAGARHLRRKAAQTSRINSTRPKLLETLALTGLVAGPAAYRQSASSVARLPAGPDRPTVVLEPPPPVTERARPEPTPAATPRWADAALVALIAAAVAVALTPAPVGARVVVMLVAACLVPGGALVRYLGLDFGVSWLAIAAAVSLGVEVLASLALVWTGWWHPEVLAIGLGAVSVLLIVLDWSRRRAAPALPV